MRFISELRCKGSEFFANRQTFRRKFSCKGQKSWFRRASQPVAGHPWLPSRAGGTGSGRGRLEPADSKSGKQSAWQQNGIRVKSNDQFGFKSIYKNRRRSAMRAGSGAKRPILGRGSARSGAQQGPFSARSSRCRQRAGLQAVGGGGRYVGPERNILTTPGAPLTWQASLLTTKKIVKHTTMPLPSKNFSLYLQLKSAHSEAADPPGRNIND